MMTIPEGTPVYIEKDGLKGFVDTVFITDGAIAYDVVNTDGELKAFWGKDVEVLH